MEPCAPGTEDDPPIMYSTLNKQETEQERLLKQKAILKNGQYDNIFELSYVNGAEHWFCNVCRCPVMGRVFQHEIGKRHTQNLAMKNYNVDVSRRNEPEENSMSIDVAPGEPVPPGFEEEIGRVAQIQDRLDGFKVGPLIALEYLLELQDYDPSKEPVYLCILCDKRGDPRTVLTHLASYNHISQYLQKHFPTCYRSLAPYMTKQYKRNWQVTLQKVAEAIEQKFGRLKPYPIEKDKFEKDRLHYLQIVSKGKHFSEQSGWTFEELIVHDELTKSHEAEEKSYESSTSKNWGGSAYIEKPFKKRSPSPPVVACPSKRNKTSPQIPRKQLPAYTQAEKDVAKSSALQNRRRSLSSVSSISSSDLSDSGSKRKGKDSPRIKKSPSPRGRQLPYQRRRSLSPKRRSLSPKRRSPPRRKFSPMRKGEMPWQNPNYQKQKNEFAEKRMTEKEKEKIRKIEEYRKLARAIENDMHKTLKQHEKNPEKHPQYNDEWKKFWNKRYKELQVQGVDASKHDFKPEWIEFWNKRMIELHSDELRNRKDALRKRLGLPEEINPIKFKIGGVPSPKEVTKENRPNLPMAAQPDQDNEVIVIDDKDEDSKSQSPRDKEKRAKLRAGQSPLPYSRMRSPKRSRSREKDRSQRSPHRRRSKSRDIYTSKRSRSKDRSHSREILERGSSRSKDYRSPSRELIRSKEHKDIRDRDRRSLSRDKSIDKIRERKAERMEYRESSYERDMRGRERVRTVADLPWEREKLYRTHYDDYYKPPSIMRDVTRKPVIIPDIPGMPVMLPPDDDDDDKEVNIVDVLRILTALEERLGSLGPKINDLLAQALALEKKEANSSETLLDSDLNCVLFETVKEKLKGQLLAGLVDILQERAFKKAIKKTAALVHMASQRKKQREKLLPKVKPVVVPGVGTVDKAAIAKQIATALIMQGKTDVTQAELEQLINAVVGMAEASKNSDKPMTTASFLQQISVGDAIFSSEKQIKDKEQEEKVIIPSSHKKSEVVELEKLTEPLTPSPGKSSTGNMENLSDLDLQTLLQNFKDLSTDEQHNLINYLKKLETHEPERVERLRKFVNLDPSKKEENEETESKPISSNERSSPFSNRTGSRNPAHDDLIRIESDEEDMLDEKEETVSEEKEKVPAKVHLDSEDEDYTFEDVVKAASKNVKEKELENNMKIVEESMKFESNKSKKEGDLSDAKSLISNLMSNFSKANSNSNTVDLLGLGGPTSKPSTSTSDIITSTADFAKTLSSINIANLVSIVSNVKKLTPEPTIDKRLNFEPPFSRPNSGKLNFNPELLRRPVSPRSFFQNEPSFENTARSNISGRQGLGLDIGGSSRGPSGIGPLPGSGGSLRMPAPSFGSLAAPTSLRDNRGLGMPPRDIGSRHLLTQYPRNTGSYGSSYGNTGNDFPPGDRDQYSRPNVLPGDREQFSRSNVVPGDRDQYTRPNLFDQRNRMDGNPRFGGNMNLYNNRPAGGNFRW